VQQQQAKQRVDAIMSGTLHGQSWSNLLGLGLLAPKEQLLSHIRKEVETNCAYDTSGQCKYGQQTLPTAVGRHTWARDGSPSMNFDNAANAMWIGAETCLLLPLFLVVKTEHFLPRQARDTYPDIG
jgi:hypothetical protein